MKCQEKNYNPNKPLPSAGGGRWRGLRAHLNFTVRKVHESHKGPIASPVPWMLEHGCGHKSTCLQPGARGPNPLVPGKSWEEC